MNPLLLLIVILVLGNNKRGNGYIPGGSPFSIGRSLLPGLRFDYFDTFKMELLLDRMRTITEAMEKLNHLRQVQSMPQTREASIEKMQDSVDAAKGFLADTKAATQLNTISDTLSGVKQLGDMSGLLSSIGPLLSMFAASGNEHK